MTRVTIKELGLKFASTKTEKDFSNLYNRVKPNLVNFVSNIVRDMDDAEDIVSEAMSKVFNKIDQYDPMYNISTWIYRIAQNDAYLFLKRKARKNTQNFSTFNTFDTENSSLNKILSNVGVENGYIIKETKTNEENEIDEKFNSIIEIIDNLPEKYQNIMRDRLIYEMSYDDISKKYDVEMNTIKTRIKRGRERIVKNYEELETI